MADREALMAEEQAYAEAQRAKDEEDEKKPSSRRSSRSRSRSKTKAEDLKSGDAVETKEVETEISGMETIDLSEPEEAGTPEPEVPEGSSPMERVAETPVEEPEDNGADEGAGAAPAAEPAAEEAVAEEAPAEEASADAEEDKADTGDEDDTETGEARSDAAAKDSSIESVADDDDQEDIRPPRKPRPRRYKIQEVIKVRQILLVQVVKEERGNKGAALTTYLSLAGRYCVLMPNTARGGGISRKITNATDRKKLKEIAAEIDVPKGAGLIIRTAGPKRTKAEIKRDYEYLQRLWEQIRELTLKSIAPAKIYEEGDLIKRSIRDLYNREIDEVLVEGERGYRIAKDFMKMIMPSHAKNVRHYQDALPLFARFQVESYLGGMFNPTVQLKSGGYIVIGVTEALVAIDVNSGRATKQGSIEETALNTNLEAAEEVARQLRLRDLAGLIVIDFIDMDERKNNAAVEKRMKDKLKTDRARIQVGRISGFGLMEMSRQRLRPGMIEATTQPCSHCHGTGLIRSDDSMALSILRQIEEEGTRRRSREVLVRCPVAIANYLMNQKREHIAQIEARYGLSVRIEGDMHLVSPDFTIEKFKTASRIVAAAEAPVVSVDTSIMDQVDAEESEAEEAAAAQPETVEDSDSEDKPKRKRRRRRRRKSSGGGEAGSEATSDETEQGEGEENGSADEDSADTSDEAEGEAKPEKKTRRRRTRGGRSRSKKDEAAEEEAETGEASPEVAETSVATEADADAVEGAQATAANEALPADAAEETADLAQAETSSQEVQSDAVAETADVETADAETGDAETGGSETAEAETEVSEVTEAEPADLEVEPAAAHAEEASETSEADNPETEEAATAEAEAEPALERTPEPEGAEGDEEPTATESAVETQAGSEPTGVEPTAAEPAAKPEPELVAAEAEPAAPPKPKRRGWWSMS